MSVQMPFELELELSHDLTSWTSKVEYKELKLK